MNESPARFLLEENGFLRAGVLQSFSLQIEVLCELISFLHESKQAVERHSQLEFCEVIVGMSLAEVMYSPELSPLSHDQRIQLMTAINRCTHWDDEPNQVPSDFIVDKIKLVGLTLSCAFKRSLIPRAICCIGLESKAFPEGWKDVRRVADGAVRPLCFLQRESQLPTMFRRMIIIEDCNPEDFIELCPLAFPHLYCPPVLTQQFAKFETPYSAARQLVVNHLSGLNDFFRTAMERHHGQPDQVAAELKSSAAIVISPESPNTHKNKIAMREREVFVDDKVLVCEWHTKLHPERDRIHFHPGHPKVAGGRIVIGLFAHHLTT